MSEKRADPAALLCAIEFYNTESAAPVTAMLWGPFFDDKTGSFFCEHQLVGMPEMKLSRSHGGNPLFAIINSMTYFWSRFSKLPGEYRSRDGDMPHMCFPRFIPWTYGTDVYGHLCAVLDGEIQKLEDELTARRLRFEENGSED